jgi:hypothetical protein
VYGDDNPYRYVRNNPPWLVDPFGLWGQDIHPLATTNWATIYFAQTAAGVVGNGDEAVDHGPTNPVTGDWSYHFDIPTPPINVLRPFYAGDSRGRRFGEYRAESLQAVNRSNCARAFEMLGRALHPLQDYYAHGNWGRVARVFGGHEPTGFIPVGMMISRDPARQDSSFPSVIGTTGIARGWRTWLGGT